MFYKLNVQDHIRVPPDKFGDDLESSILSEVKESYEGHISKELGSVIDVIDVRSVGEGSIIPGDGAAYYECTFTLLTFIPEEKEVVYGQIQDIADFGAFLTMGPTEGMVHISQTMDDFVSFSKEGVLTGRDSNKTLKVGGKCKARIISVSYKNSNNPKTGLTMRQDGLGKIRKEEQE
jgi:DNA-directed RNA polymerase subunit E'